MEAKLKETVSQEQSVATSQQLILKLEEALKTQKEVVSVRDSDLSDQREMVLQLRRELEEERAALESVEAAKTALEKKVRPLILFF